jgi:chorismate mutase/prephenate dehydratase
MFASPIGYGISHRLKKSPGQPSMSSSAEAAPGADHATFSPADSLPALRQELDVLDDRILDLLMRRAAIVERVAVTKRGGGPLRPGREANIIRRLLAQHEGALPRHAIVRIWREIFSSSVAQQQSVLVAVCDPTTDGRFAAAAREQFGALTPLRVYRSAAQAIGEVVEGRAGAAILPLPGEGAAEGATGPEWWPGLLQQHHKGRIHVVARLPFWRIRPEGAPAVQALVIASSPADPSGDDISLIALEMETQISRASLSQTLTTAGFKPLSILLDRPQGAPVAQLLVEVEGFVALDDPRLARIGALQAPPLVVGAYAVAIAEEHGPQ